MTWPSVLSHFAQFNAPLEGVEHGMYADSLGHVTTGMGYEIDSIPEAQALPWQNPDGSLASASDVAAAWTVVKNAFPGVQSVNSLSLTSIRIPQTAVDAETVAREQVFEGVLAGFFPGWISFPADGQMGILSMAWAMGAGFPAGFPQFTAAVNAGQWNSAAALSDFKGSGVAPRIAANKVLFGNAAIVMEHGLDPSVLYWPAVASSVWYRPRNIILGAVAFATGAAVAWPAARRVAAQAASSAKEWLLS